MNYFEQNNINLDHQNLSDHEYNQEDNHANDYKNPDMEPTRGWSRKPNTSINVFAMFARSLGIFSVFCAFFSIFFGAFICGGMAVILAILSKGYNTKMERNAKFGLVAGIIGIVFQLTTITVSVYNIINVPEYRENFNSLYEQIYGAPVDDSINNLLDQLQFSNTEGGIL